MWGCCGRADAGISLSSLAQGSREWKARRGARSASGASPSLPQEPVGPNFAFALGGKRGHWGGGDTSTLPNDGNGDGCLRRGLGEGEPYRDLKGS